MRKLTVGRCYCATAAGVALHVDRTASVSSLVACSPKVSNKVLVILLITKLL